MFMISLDIHKANRMSNTWHIPIRFIFYRFREFKLKTSTPLISFKRRDWRCRGEGGGWGGGGGGGGGGGSNYA